MTTTPEPGAAASGRSLPGDHVRGALPPRVRVTGTHRPWMVTAVRVFGDRLARVVFRLRVVDRSGAPSGPVIYAGNHASFLDGPLLFLVAPRPAVFLVKSEMFTRGLERALGWLGQVPVHRDRADREALKAALDELKRGGAVGMFPEGSRGAGTLDQVQHGVALLALRSGAPVVPVAVLGSAAALPHGTGRIRLRAPVLVELGPAFHITTSGEARSRRALAEAAEQIRGHLVNHLTAVRAEHRGEFPDAGPAGTTP